METTAQQQPRRRRSRGFSLSLSINSPRLSRRQSLASSMASPTPPTPASPAPSSRFKRALKRIGSFRIFPSRNHSSASSYHWPMVDTDYMYDDDIDVSYEGLLSLAARIGDAKPRNLPSEFKAALPKAIYKDCPSARVDEKCAICLDKYEDHNEVMGITECSHYFHTHCFETWLDLASNCPVCRRELTPEDYRFDISSTSSPPMTPIEPGHLMDPTPFLHDFGASLATPSVHSNE